MPFHLTKPEVLNPLNVENEASKDEIRADGKESNYTLEVPEKRCREAPA